MTTFSCMVSSLLRVSSFRPVGTPEPPVTSMRTPFADMNAPREASLLKGGRCHHLSPCVAIRLHDFRGLIDLLISANDIIMILHGQACKSDILTAQQLGTMGDKFVLHLNAVIYDADNSPRCAPKHVSCKCDPIPKCWGWCVLV
jgi:hypothetical protein